ncbi:MAG: ATP-binding cassette domain-containing protein [Clostridiaceae bacterium]|nr:ATP-binding cassette domain-containing protein [Clostridiaceae bacterium]MBW4860659.1 ATP-binding cassette domain-containing protein [Clostridiaceae bacterium]MBW4868955.1 ATP-binding cassette domain-containing protein [Clostridiaceae bacterium]
MIEVDNIKKSFVIPVKKDGRFLKNLMRREYIRKEAVKGISFSIDKGELIGYIGLNGAGKSTTIKMLCGILKPDSGSIKVNGLDPFENRRENNMNMGVLFGQRGQLWTDLPVQDSFLLLKKIYNVSNEDYKKRIEFLDNELNIGEIMKIPVRKLSLGQRMRCEFAGSLIHWPSIIYLDEPTIGLDILTKKKALSLIKKLNEKCGKTIIFTTHNMQDIEDLCDRVVLIDNGKIIYDGKTQKLKASYTNQKILSITFDYIGNNDKENLIKVLKKSGKILNTCNNSLQLLINDGKIHNMKNILNEINKVCEITDYDISSIKFENVIENIYTIEAKS